MLNLSEMLSLQHVITMKLINEILHISLLALSLWNWVCILNFSTSQIGQDTCPVLISHRWLLAMESDDLDFIFNADIFVPLFSYGKKETFMKNGFLLLLRLNLLLLICLSRHSWPSSLTYSYSLSIFFLIFQPHLSYRF